MKIIASTGRDDVATVYIAEMAGERLIEFVESVQPPIPREVKWVLLVSTMYGCPVGCMMCDAGGYYQGKPTREEIFEQIDFLVYKRYPDGNVPTEQFKIQFARMGEPSLNQNVLDVLEELNGDGQTIIMVTHNDKTACRAGRIIRLADGKIVE